MLWVTGRERMGYECDVGGRGLGGFVDGCPVVRAVKRSEAGGEGRRTMGEERTNSCLPHSTGSVP